MVKALKTTAYSDEDDAVEIFNMAVQKKMKKGLSRDRAVEAIARMNPELHKNFLLATNPQARSRRLINEKFDLREE
jgi:hypothetical protein